MSQVFIDWNLTDSCAAECPWCHFWQRESQKITQLPTLIQQTWEALQSALGDSVEYSHDIMQPLDQVRDCDFTALASSTVSELKLNLSRQEDENPHIVRILEQVDGSTKMPLAFVVPPNTPYKFDESIDIPQFVSRMQKLFSLQVEQCLSDVTVSFVQNQIPTPQYHKQVIAFSWLIRSFLASGKGGYIRTHPYVWLAQSFIDSVVQSNFFQVEESYFSRSSLHHASSISREYNKFCEYAWKLQWHNNKCQSFGIHYSLMEKIPSFLPSEQLLQARSANRLFGIPLMFTPNSVYLHHSPETIKNPNMCVSHTTFQSWLQSISDWGEGFSGLKKAIDDYFKKLK